MAHFQVTQAPGYWDNQKLHPPGTVLDIPEEEFGVLQPSGIAPGASPTATSSPPASHLGTARSTSCKPSHSRSNP